MTPSAVVYFAGGGLASIGIRDAGFQLVDAVEFNPNPKYGSEHVIAEWYAKNISKAITCKSVIDIDPSVWIGVDLFQCSPPCPNFSVAKTGATETADDLALAEACTRFIRVVNPKLVIVENVGKYRGSESFRIICKALADGGYFYDFDLLNSADFGVPQTRRRLILRAVRDNFIPHLSQPIKPWNGWYTAVEDLLPMCPESEFAPWQLQRIDPILRSFIVGVGGEGGDLMYDASEPTQTISSSHTAGKYRAFLAHPDSDSERFPFPQDDLPSFTVGTFQSGRPKAVLINGQYNAPNTNPERSASIQTDNQGAQTITSQTHRDLRAWLSENGRVVKMTSRCLARFQSMPDWYELPTKDSLAGRIIGNGMPCLMMQKIAEGMRQTL